MRRKYVDFFPFDIADLIGCITGLAIRLSVCLSVCLQAPDAKTERHREKNLCERFPGQE